MHTKRTILLLLSIVVLIAAIGVVYVFNKPHRDVKDEAAIVVNADSLFKAFSSDEETANKLYLDKALVVEGTVMEVLTNQQGQHVILLKTSDPIAAVSATFTEMPKATISKGLVIKIKGICSGYASDVVLRDCIVEGVQ